MPTNKPRLSSTLERELERGAIYLRAQGIDNTQIVSEGIVALAMLDVATRNRVKQFTSLLRTGHLTWSKFLGLLRENQKAQERALEEGLELQAKHELGESDEPPAKQAKAR